MATTPAAATLVAVPSMPTGDAPITLPLGTTATDRWLLTHRWHAAADPVGRGWTVEPRMALVLQHGTLWQLDLQAVAGTRPTPSRVSAAADLCRLVRAHELDPANGDDSWVEVERAGADNRCDTTLDNARAWVRLSDGRLEPAAEGLTPLAALRTSDGGLQFLLAHDGDTGRLLLQPAGALQAMVEMPGATAGIAAVEWLAQGPATAQGGTAYLRVNGRHVRRLTWTAAGASLGPELHRHLTSPTAGAVHDGTALYLGDGADLWRVDTGSSAAVLHARLPSADGTIARLETAGGHVLVTQGFSRPALWAVAKDAGRPPVRLGGGPGEARHHTFVGHLGNTVVFSSTDDPLGAALGRATLRLFRVSLGETTSLAPTPAPSPLADGVALAGVVARPSGLEGEARVEALVVCVPAAATPGSDCRGAALQQIDLASGQTTLLGTLPAHPALSGLVLAASAAPGQPALARLQGSRPRADAAGTTETWTDLWSWSPGSAGSLAPVAATLP